MKTTILQLETHDDLISIRDKIEWCKSQRIILVFPKKIKRNPNVLELRLIQRSAIAKGAEVALVTRDRFLTENAGEVGIPVFYSIPLAQRGNWNKSANHAEGRSAPKGIQAILDARDLIVEDLEPRELNPATRIIVFLLALAALISLAAFIIPSTQITVYPVAEAQSIILEVSASTKAESVSITGVIPASERSFSLSLDKTATSSGTTALGQTKSTGEFLVNNLTQNDLLLPAGTTLSVGSDIPIRFVSLTDFDLHAGENSEVLKVEALLPGEEGNIAAGTPALVEGIFGSMVETVAADTFTNGSSSMLPAPTDDDYVKLRQKILDELETRALEYLAQLESETEKAIQGTLVMDEILTETRVNPVGEPSDSLTLELNVQFKVLVYDTRDITKLMMMILDTNLQKGFHSVGSDITIESIGNVNTPSNDSAEWQVKGTRPIVKDWDSDRIRALIQGKETSEALTILDAEISHIKDAVILQNPKYWPRLPLLSTQIHIEEIISQ